MEKFKLYIYVYGKGFKFLDLNVLLSDVRGDATVNVEDTFVIISAFKGTSFIDLGDFVSSFPEQFSNLQSVIARFDVRDVSVSFLDAHHSGDFNPPGIYKFSWAL